MKTTRTVERILEGYGSDSPGVKANLRRLLMAGRLGGTGKMIILPVDQGFEHGPARSFAANPEAYDPSYHAQLAVEAGLSAHAAPLGMLEISADRYAGQIPLILKLNSSNSLLPKAAPKDQAITGSVQDALRLGCSAVGLTVYPGSGSSLDMFEEAAEIIAEAKDVGLASVVWSYPRGEDLGKDGETGFDVTAYAAHIAALLGAHVIKVKLPSAHLEQADAKKVYQAEKVPSGTQAERVSHVVQSCFAGKRLVVFSGGATKGTDSVYEDARAIRDGGGNGSIIGRNVFQRPRAEALAMLNELVSIYRGKA